MTLLTRENCAVNEKRAQTGNQKQQDPLRNKPSNSPVVLCRFCWGTAATRPPGSSWSAATTCWPTPPRWASASTSSACCTTAGWPNPRNQRGWSWRRRAARRRCLWPDSPSSASPEGPAAGQRSPGIISAVLGRFGARTDITEHFTWWSSFISNTHSEDHVRGTALFLQLTKKTLMDDGVHVSNLERKRRTKKKLAVLHQIFMSNTKRQFLLKSIVKLFWFKNARK